MKTEDKRKASAEIAATVRSITASVCLRCIANNENPAECQGYDMLRALDCIKGMLKADDRI